MFWIRNLRALASAKSLVSHKTFYSTKWNTKCSTNLVKLGQPTSWTHPHLLKAGEISPNIKLDEYINRRHKLLKSIQMFSVDKLSSSRNHLIIIPSAVKKYMSDKIPYPFRQNTDFLYLTGCLEPDSILLLSIDENDHMNTALFMRPKDANAELWDGPRTGLENSIEYFGVEESFSVNNFENVMKEKELQFSSKSDKLTVWYDSSASEQKNLYNMLNFQNMAMPLQNPSMIIQALRVIKSESEIELMRRTCEIASESLNEVMNETIVGDSEHYLYARMDYKCRMRDASYLAYPPVVASGTNATSIHYINNSQTINDNDLILMDAGCEYGGYTSDITRTWPVSRKFTSPQKILYDIVYSLQKELLDTLSQRKVSNLNELFDVMCFKIGLYLQDVGLIKKSLNGLDLARAGFSFCPHHVSHYLGMDVHDTPLITRNTAFKSGMVCTVEPGIYIQSDRLDVPEEFRGIGIRIEDDVLITDTGLSNLTQKCNKIF